MRKYMPLVRISMVKEKEVPYAAETINGPGKAAELAKTILKDADREYLLVLSVDSKCRPLAVEIVLIGTVNATLTEAREIFKHTILAGTAGIIIAHNHISGDCTPSEENEEMTRRVSESGELFGIPVRDHVIIGDGYFSFHEEERKENI